jgi:hypothetical protein
VINEFEKVGMEVTVAKLHIQYQRLGGETEKNIKTTGK